MTDTKAAGTSSTRTSPRGPVIGAPSSGWCRHDHGALLGWFARPSARSSLDGVVPATPGLGQPVGGEGTPRALLVEVHPRRLVEDGLDHSPRLLDRVGPGEPPVVAVHGVVEQALVGLLPPAERLVERHLEVHRAGGELLA